MDHRLPHTKTPGDLRPQAVISSAGALQDTILSPVLFTLYTNDFIYKSQICHMQKFSDDTAVVGCIRNGQEVQGPCGGLCGML